MKQADFLKSYGWTGKRENGHVFYTHPFYPGKYTINDAMTLQAYRNAHRANLHTKG